MRIEPYCLECYSYYICVYILSYLLCGVACEMEMLLDEAAQNRLEDERGASSMAEAEEHNGTTAQRSSLEMVTKPLLEEEDSDGSPVLFHSIHLNHQQQQRGRN